MQIRRFSASFLATLVLAGLLDFASARAATFTVTKTEDTADGDCSPTDCSLREAVIAANSLPGKDTIIVPAGTYVLYDHPPLYYPMLEFTDDAEMVGAGAGATTIPDSGGRLVWIHKALNDTRRAVNLTIEGVAFRGNGNEWSSNPIYSEGGNVVLRSCTFSGWSSRGKPAINIIVWAEGGSASLDRCTISDNSFAWLEHVGFMAGVYGFMGATVSVTDSTISNNHFLSDPGDGIGAGVYIQNGTATIRNTTISDNSMAGAISIDEGGDMTVVNSTIANNGLDVVIFRGRLTLASSTIRSVQGGIWNAGDVTISNTLLASQCASDYGALPLQSLGGNLESPGDTCGLLDPTDQVNVPDPMIGPLADNGGPTQTMALLPGSPAIDRALAANCPATDQRGVSRPQGSACDVGSFERTWWDDAANLDGGWRWFSWFGTFNVTYDPWIYHAQLGWMYSVGADTSSLSFYDLMMGGRWLWTSDTVYSWLYRWDDGAWLWYQAGTAHPAWFYNSTTGAWEQYP